MAEPIIKPTVNLNGDTYKTLCEQFAECIRTIDIAMQALRNACPHGRNYPDQDKYKQDRAELDARHKTLSDMKDKFLAELDALWEQHP